MFINKTITTRLEPKKYKSICEKYHRPLNTDFLVCPRVNKELWSFINKDGPKNADLEIQELQKDYVKGLLPLVQAMNGLKEGSKEWACLADSFEIFAHQFMALNDKRRNLLKAASSLPKKLFSHEVPVTTKLFGDQFEEEIKKLDLDKKLMDSLQGSRFPPQQIWKQRRGGGPMRGPQGGIKHYRPFPSFEEAKRKAKQFPAFLGQRGWSAHPQPGTNSKHQGGDPGRGRKG